jgi:hypothetical protein
MSYASLLCVTPVCHSCVSLLCVTPVCHSSYTVNPRDNAARPKYMTPDEVEDHIAALCRKEAAALRHIYGGAGAVLSGCGGAATASAVGRAARANAALLYKCFFLRAIAVTPNRCVSVLCVLPDKPC